MHFMTFILRNLTRRPTRSALTILGLSAAVGSMIALFGITSNVEHSVVSSFEQRGIDLIVQQKGRSSGLNSDFSEDLVHQAEKIRGVERISWAVVNLINVTTDGGNEDQILIQGWRPDNFVLEDLKFISGRAIQEGDKKKVMIGDKFAENYHKKVGDKVIIGGESFEVCGVFHTNIVFEDGGAIVNLEDGRRLTSMRVTGFSVRVDKRTPHFEAEVERVRKEIEALRDPQDPTVGLEAKTPVEYTNNLAHLKLMRAVVWLVSVIAVVIGVIGLLNTMAMSILERTQEIGILRAVGWPPRRVIRMVIGEATLLSLIAAVVGTLAAAGGLFALTFAPKVNGFIESGLSWGVVVKGFAITFLIGLLGGLYPAIRAARLLPTEAIRHD